MFKISKINLLIISIVTLFLGCLDNSPINNNKSSQNPQQSVTQLEDGFYTAKVEIGGMPFYLGFDKIDDNNRKFWYTYRSQSSKIASQLKEYPKWIRWNNAQLAFPNPLAEILGYTNEEHKKIIDFFKNSPKNSDNIMIENYFHKLFSNVESEFSGMDLGDFHSNTPTRIYYVIYGSNKPIIKRLLNSDFDANKNYRDNFQDIIISMAGITANDVPTVTHTGISKNPLEFLKDKTAPLSMVLHGFGAQVWLSFFKDKKYMITQPLESMADILKSKIDKQYIWEGVYPDELNTLKSQNKDFDFSYPTMWAQRTTIVLSELAKFFLER